MICKKNNIQCLIFTVDFVTNSILIHLWTKADILIIPATTSVKNHYFSLFSFKCLEIFCDASSSICTHV